MGFKMKSKSRIIIAFVLIVFCGFIVYQKYFHLELYARYVSSDSRYIIEVYRRPMLFSFPGGASDAPGIIRLCNAKGKILREQAIEMVQIIDGVEWNDKGVYITPLGLWDLPSTEGK